ncbi:MAG TPA: DNA sulfur modification protein DndD, partial [Chthonomonadaceae bacterium]|nr:DNA sulfur modification protein DndD [Chthonomonadaceae bacterium]
WENINFANREAGKWDVTFQLEFVDADQNLLRLTRAYVPQTYSRESPPFEMSLRLNINGNNVEEDNENIQDRIEQLFPRDVAQFFLFDGEEIKSLAETTDRGNAEQIKTSMEHLLGLRFFKILQDDLQVVRSRIARNENAARQSDVDQLRADMTRIDEEIEQQKRRKQELLDERKRQEQRLKRAEDNFAELNEASTRYQKLRSQRLQLENRQRETEKQISQNINETLAYALVADSIQQIIACASQEVDRKVELHSRDQIAERLEQLLKEMRAEYACLCGRALSEPRYWEIEDRLRTALLGDDEQSETVAPTLFDLKIADLSILQAQLDRSRLRATLDDLCLQMQQILEEIDGCDRDLRAVADIEDRAKELEGLRKVRDEANIELGRIKNELSTISQRLTDLPKQRDAKTDELSRKTELLLRSQRAVAMAKMIGQTNQLLEELSQEARQDKLAALQKHVTAIFRRLWSKGDLLDRVEFDPDTYATSIILTDGSQIIKRDLAAGEKELFALSLLGGLAKCADRKLPVVIDTPLSRLDSEHRGNIIHQYYPDAGEQIFLLSTDTEITPNLFAELKPHIRQTFTLQHDAAARSTTVSRGYFMMDSEGR